LDGDSKRIICSSRSEGELRGSPERRDRGDEPARRLEAKLWLLERQSVRLGASMLAMT